MELAQQPGEWSLFCLAQFPSSSACVTTQECDVERSRSPAIMALIFIDADGALEQDEGDGVQPGPRGECHR